jgi:stalled ribosome rescue protein Dom34
MHRNAGLWIDHKDAFIVFTDDPHKQIDETEAKPAGIARHIRFVERSSAESSSAEDHRDRQHANHLTHFYDEVISYLQEAQSILIFGPGEAKGELKKRMQKKALADRIVGVQAADRMTEHQIVAHARKYYDDLARGLAMPS